MRRVLIVDDDPALARGLQRLLEAMGHEALAVHDGASALAALRDWRPDVALVDIGLPDMDGEEVARRAKRDSLRVVLVGMTASHFEGQPARALAAGFDDFIEKPLTAAKLDAVLG